MLDDAGFLGNSGQENAEVKWYCEKCDYSTCYESKWNRHIKTKKHNAGQMLVDAGSLGNSGQEKAEVKWRCDCGKQYKHNQSYYRHKKTCTYKPPAVETETQNQIVSSGIDKDAIILELFKKMSEMQEHINNLSHRVGNHNTVNTNSHNINLYLNNECKEAMSIQAFASLLTNDIEKEQGVIYNGKDHKPFLELLAKKIRVLEQTARPIHSHKKTMYLKDEVNGWNKDTEGVAANTVISAAKKAELKKLPSLYPNWQHDEKQQEAYLNTVSDLTDEVSKKDKEEFEKMKCIELDLE